MDTNELYDLVIELIPTEEEIEQMYVQAADDESS